MNTLPRQSPPDRAQLVERYERNRRRSRDLFALIDDDAYYSRPIALRHPFAFYEGHLPAFSFLVLNERALRQAPIDAYYEKLFERGIDPGTMTDAHKLERSDWPTKQEIVAFGRRCDERVIDALLHATLEDASVPRLHRAQSAYTILEHEEMHHETLAYIIHRLDPKFKRRVVQEHIDHRPPVNDLVAIDAGIATLGANRDDLPFGWDNEFCAHELAVAPFGIQRYPVTNGEYLDFVRAGGPVPPFWVPDGSGFALLGAFQTLPLPLSWPVYTTHEQAEAYAQWRAMRLPAEAEYHRAAYGSPNGIERPQPWGAAPPTAEHGNFDFRRWDPEPVDAHPGGASAWGVMDLVGNGWEWTSTAFSPFPGFEPMASYPQYSKDFFDGKHFVIKGASPVTARELVRRSFRNWFYGNYPYMYATFRCVA